GPHVLAGGDDLAGDLGVRGGDRQVDDDLDVGVAQHVLGGAGGRDAVFLGALRGGLGEQVSDDVDRDVGEGGEVREVLGGDGAGADDADADGAGLGLGGHTESPSWCGGAVPGAG